MLSVVLLERGGGAERKAKLLVFLGIKYFANG